MRGTARARSAAALLALVLPLASCGEGVLDPAGPDARRIERLWWWSFWLGLLVVVIVVVALVAALAVRRRDGEAAGKRALVPVLLGGVGLPAVILPVVFGLTLDAMTDVVGDEDEPLVIEVIGNQWWWEIRYPDLDIVTANEVHLPTGRDVELRLTSDDVIHSFWVPELGGKRDLIPGKVVTLGVRADQPGIFDGRCAEYCGLQHTKMDLLAIVLPAEEFDEWALATAAPADPPRTELATRGQLVFLDQGCGTCHRIAGTAADGQLGPDLTHLASRLSLGAVTVPNTRGHLAGWVVNPHSIKEGVKMPFFSLEPDELEALLDYLEQLE